MHNIILSPHIGFDRLEGLLTASQRQIEIATQRALNKTARQLLIQVARYVADKEQIKVSLIKQQLMVLKANKGSLLAGIQAKQKRLKLTASQLGSGRQVKDGVKVGKHHFKKAFKTKNKQMIYRRAPNVGRLPIYEPYIIVTPTLIEAMQTLGGDQALRQFERHFQHELKFLLRP